MDKLLSVIFMVGVLLLVLPGFLQSNSQLKQFLKNFTIWILVILIILIVIFLFFGLAINLSSFLIGFAGSLIIAREIWISALRDYNARNNNANATKVIYIAKIKTSIQLFTILVYLIGLAFNKMLLIIF